MSTQNNTADAIETLAAAYFGSRQISGRPVRTAAIHQAVTDGLTPETVADVTGLHIGYLRSLLPASAR